MDDNVYAAEAVARPSGWDVCCAGGRRPADFDPEMGNSLSTQEVFVLLKNNQVGINMAVLIQLGISVLWLLTSLVPGFALFDGAPGETSAVSHIGWWAAIEIVVIYVGSQSTSFSLHYNKKGQIEKGVDRAMTYLWFYQSVLFLAVAAHIVHVVLALIESTNCTSTLCVSGNGFLIALIVFLFILTFILLWLALWLVPGYRRNLKYSLAFEKNDMVMMAPEPAPADDTYAPSAPPYSPEDGLETPLLAEVRKARRGNPRATAHGVVRKHK